MGESFSLQIEDQSLAAFDLSVILDPFGFNQFMLSPWTMSFFVSCTLPSCFMLFSWAHLGLQCYLYNLLEGQPENSWPLGGEYYIIPNPSRNSGLLPCFLQHMQQQYLSVIPLRWVTGPQCRPRPSNGVGPTQKRTGSWTSPRCQFLQGINTYKSW